MTLLQDMCLDLRKFRSTQKNVESWLKSLLLLFCALDVFSSPDNLKVEPLLSLRLF